MAGIYQLSDIGEESHPSVVITTRKKNDTLVHESGVRHGLTLKLSRLFAMSGHGRVLGESFTVTYVVLRSPPKKNLRVSKDRAVLSDAKPSTLPLSKNMLAAAL